MLAIVAFTTDPMYTLSNKSHMSTLLVAVAYIIFHRTMTVAFMRNNGSSFEVKKFKLIELDDGYGDGVTLFEQGSITQD